MCFCTWVSNETKSRTQRMVKTCIWPDQNFNILWEIEWNSEKPRYGQNLTQPSTSSFCCRWHGRISPSIWPTLTTARCDNQYHSCATAWRTHTPDAIKSRLRKFRLSWASKHFCHEFLHLPPFRCISHIRVRYPNRYFPWCTAKIFRKPSAIGPLSSIIGWFATFLAGSFFSACLDALVLRDFAPFWALESEFSRPWADERSVEVFFECRDIAMFDGSSETSDCTGGRSGYKRAHRIFICEPDWTLALGNFTSLCSSVSTLSRT